MATWECSNFLALFEKVEADGAACSFGRSFFYVTVSINELANFFTRFRKHFTKFTQHSDTFLRIRIHLNRLFYQRPPTQLIKHLLHICLSHPLWFGLILQPKLSLRIIPDKLETFDHSTVKWVILSALDDVFCVEAESSAFCLIVSLFQFGCLFQGSCICLPPFLLNNIHY